MYVYVTFNGEDIPRFLVLVVLKMNFFSHVAMLTTSQQEMNESAFQD